MSKARSLRRTTVRTLAAVGLALGLAVPAAGAAHAMSVDNSKAVRVAGAADDTVGPQAPRAHEPVPTDEHPVPYVCNLYTQLLPTEQRYRTTDNEPFVYTDSTFGTSWFDVKCGYLTFTVPAGQEALVDLTATAELDCGHRESPSLTGGWCGGRFTINGAPLPDPQNTGLENSYAWDEATDGGYDYQSHTLAQVYKADCQKSTTGAECFYRVQLQSRLEAGARSIWIDDLTMRVDVNEGPVTIVP